MRQGGALRNAAIFAALAGTLVLMLPAHGANRTVEARGLTFVPPVVLAGGTDTITFTNREPINIPFLAHTFTTDALICLRDTSVPPDGIAEQATCDTGAVTVGASATVQLNVALVSPLPTVQNPTPNVYEFYCSIHSIVVGGQRVGTVGRLRIG